MTAGRTPLSESTHTTGDTPVDGLDPGGTHSTHPGKPTDKGPVVEHSVESGDQNTHPERTTDPD